MAITLDGLNGYLTQINNNSPNAIANYYAYLTSNGLPYGTLAGEVAGNTGFDGEFANSYLKEFIREAHPDFTDTEVNNSRDSIVKNLAVRDINTRVAQFDTNGGNINTQSIADYHWDGMEANGLPREAWAGTLLQELVGDGSWMKSYDPSHYQVTEADIVKAVSSIRDNVTTADGFSANDLYHSFIQHAMEHNNFWHAFNDDKIGAAGDAYHYAFNLASPLVDFIFSAYLGVPSGTLLSMLPDVHLSSTLHDVGSLFNQGLNSPVVLDLNGDGIHYTSLADSHVFFDIENDHFAEHVEWLDGTDGLLVRDLNADGQINSVGEMFGNDGGTSAYAKLAALDSNADGKLSSADAAWSTLKLWVDANTNGYVDANEMKTMAQASIKSINVNGNSDTVYGGHAVDGTGSYKLTDNTSHKTADVLFGTDQMDSWYVGDGTPESTNIDLDTLSLPLSRGYGTLPSLHYAMTQDTDLKTLVENFATMDIATQMHTVYDQADAILLKWSHSEDINPHSRGDYTDARHLDLLEKLNDTPYHNIPFNTDDPPAQYGSVINYDYDLFYDEMLTRLLVQGPLQSVFQNAHYDFTQDKVELDDTISNLMTQAQANAPTASADKTTYWNEIARVVNEYHDDLGLTDTAAKAAVDAAAGFATAIAVWGGTLDNDYAGGGAGNDLLIGGAGNDTLSPDTGDDTMIGGAGNDSMLGWEGNDVYVFGNESGNDKIDDELINIFDPNYDAVILQNTTSSQVALSKSGIDLTIGIANLSETITFQNQYYTNLFGDRVYWYSLEELQFSNGVMWNVDAIDAVAAGGAAPGILNGTTGNDVLTPNSSKQNVVGKAGTDTFVLNGNENHFLTIADFHTSESDRIDITAFDGQVSSLADLHLDDLGGHATLSMPGISGDVVNLSGINSSQIDVTYFLSNTLDYGAGVTVNGTASADTLGGGWHNDTYNGNDGADSISSWTGNDSVTGGNGNDTLSGSYGQDTIYGGNDNDSVLGDTGNDSLNGDAGDDRLYGNDGNDTIYCGTGADVVYGGNNDDSARGGDDGDTMSGEDGVDTLNGENGNDYLYGGDGIDTLVGALGNDYIKGDAGTDRIYGDEGNDSLFGGTEADTFYMKSGSGVDKIYDFEGAGTSGTGSDDTIRIESNLNGSGITDFASLSSHITYDDANSKATIDFGGGNNVTLMAGVGAGHHFISSDFSFY